MNKEVSPEERLFNVIKAGKDPSGPFRAGNSFRLPGAAIDMPLPFGVPAGLRDIDLNKANKILAAVFLFLIAAVVVTLAHKKEVPLKRLSQASSVNSPVTSATGVLTYQPVDFYLRQVRKRDLFHPVAAGAAAPADTAPAANKDFVLSGIYMGEYPQAIITDTSEQKAYFLKEGDEIKGYKVKSILKNKVILRQGDEEIDLL